MKTNKANKSIIPIFIVFCLACLGCSDEFLQEKRDFGGINEEVFESYENASAYVDYIYRSFFPGSGQVPGWWDIIGNDIVGHTSDEVPGQTVFNQEWSQISAINKHALGYIGDKIGTSFRNNTYTRLRQINLFLTNVDEAEGIRQEDKDLLKGQVYFWRAWQYMDLLSYYGGVPIVLEPQNPIIGGGPELDIPRSSSVETLEQALADFDRAIQLLPGMWPSGNYGRVTKGAAAAFKGKALLLWASPQFNREDDTERWQRAYQVNIEAKNILEENGFGMWQGNWDEMWLTEEGNPEAVFIYGYNNITTEDLNYWNGTERFARSTATGGQPYLVPTKNIMDLFPMADGKPIGESSNYPYDLQTFYQNRDPRFYGTFVYNGAQWPYSENPEFVQWDYRWYAEGDDLSQPIPGEITYDGLEFGHIYLKKWTDPGASNINRFAQSGTDWMELRFTEVLMNIAECATGIGNIGEAKEILIQIRERAGIENLDGSFGLSDVNGRDEMFGAIIRERAVEFAYEGKRFDDLRRWLLFNDDFGTVSRLGLEPIEGIRRQGLAFVALDENGDPYVGSSDPFLNTGNRAPVIDRQPEEYPAGIDSREEYVNYLYENYFEVRIKDDLEINDTWTFHWYNEYYFFGFPQEIMDSSPYLRQTIGWDGGTYDPLAD